jgi:hypothetical protein
MPVCETSLTAKQVAEACSIVETAATRKIAGLERRLDLMARALMALEPDGRACDVAQSILATLTAGGDLARYDREATAAWVRQIVDAAVNQFRPR